MKYEERLTLSLKRLAGANSGSLRELAKDFRFVRVYKGKTQCLCGKKHLKSRYKITHRRSKRSGIVGSKCVKNFPRKGYHSVLKT